MKPAGTTYARIYGLITESYVLFKRREIPRRAAYPTTMCVHIVRCVFFPSFFLLPFFFNYVWSRERDVAWTFTDHSYNLSSFNRHRHNIDPEIQKQSLQRSMYLRLISALQPRESNYRFIAAEREENAHGINPGDRIREKRPLTVLEGPLEEIELRLC